MFKTIVIFFLNQILFILLILRIIQIKIFIFPKNVTQKKTIEKICKHSMNIYYIVMSDFIYKNKK